MTAMLPTALDLDHWMRFGAMTAIVFVALFAAYVAMEVIQDSFDKMRQADTPEPIRRQQLNSVIQFPRDRRQ